MKKHILFLFSFLILGLIVQGQPFTTGVSSNLSAISGMTLCSGNTYYFTANVASWQNGSIVIYDNGTEISLAGFSYAGDAAKTCWTPCRVQNSTTAGGARKHWFILDGDANTVTMQTSAPVCSSPPTVTTDGDASVSCTSQNLSGEVTANGGAAITERGFIRYEGGADDREIGDAGVTKISEADADIEAFTLSASSLSGSTTYKYRAYATNSAGTGYGAQSTFTTAACSAPTVAATVAAGTVGCFTADPGGNVTADGGATITERGLVYGTSSNPTTADTKVVQAGTTGAWTGSLTGLSVSTLYYVRAYATNSVGTTYGTQTSFTTSGACSAPTVAATVAAGTVECSTADPGGNVTADGGDAITERGLVYGTSSNPTTGDNKMVEAGTTGAWTGSLTGLTGNTLYYVRAFATNGVGTTYGTQTSFTTSWPCLPVVPTTDAGSVITGTTATSGGNVTSNNGYALSAKGIVWNTAGTPTLGSNLGSTDEGTTVASFTSNLTGLSPSTTYYVRAYATNANGTTYGPQISFTTLATSAPVVAATVAETFYSCNDANPGGNVTSDGGSAITERGICYHTSTGPTTANTTVTDAGTTGAWTGYMSGLAASTTYYVRAYATNAIGTTYGTEISFTTDATCPTFMTKHDVGVDPLDWSNAAHWVGGVVPNINAFNNNSVGIRHNMTYTGANYTWQGNTTASGNYIKGPVTLKYTGNLTNNGYQFATSGGGTLEVGGTLTVKGALANITGDVNIDAAVVSITDNSTVTTSGRIDASTSLTVQGSSTLNTTDTIDTPDFNIAGTATVNATAGRIETNALDITVSGVLNYSNATLYVNGSVNVGASAALNAGAASPTYITGNYSNSGSVAVTFEDIFSLTGNFITSGSSPTTFAGTATVGVNVTSTSSASNITVTGTLDVTGEIALGGAAVLSGTGVVGWGTLDVNGVTSNYIQCGNFAGDRHDGLTADGTWPDPPGNPLDLNSCAAGTLPVELISFEVVSLNSSDLLLWTTGSEINNRVFEIYYTSDGKKWTKIGTVQGSGNSTVENNYSFEVDIADNGARRYYKLKQIDFDGNYAYSTIVVVEDKRMIQKLICFPNPTSREVSFITDSEVVSVQLVNAFGVVIENVDANRIGNKKSSISVESFSAGFYTISIVTASGQQYYGNFIKL